MRRFAAFFCIVTVAALFVPSAHAQTNFVFSSFQCDPAACANELFLTVQGSVSATFDSQCTGGIITGIHAEAVSTVGIDPLTLKPAPCLQPYIPRVEFDISTEQQLDDFCNEFSIDTVRQISEVLDVGRNLVFEKEISASCDGGTTGLTDFGTKPC